MDFNLPDFSEADNAKLETRFMLNAYSFMAINLFRRPNFSNYLEGHSVMNFMEVTLLGYIANRSAKIFSDLTNEFNAQRSKLPPLAITEGRPEYLTLLYNYNLKRYKNIRLLMSRYNLDKYKNKARIKD
tara:strand:- start:426 stop:812 length:387 start_codon:yes stop_codon:yes gene_type:complete